MSAVPPPEHARIERTIEAIRQEAIMAGSVQTDVSPHEFVPLRRFRNRGRCMACLAHESLHPALGWLPSRAIGDESEAVRG